MTGGWGTQPPDLWQTIDASRFNNYDLALVLPGNLVHSQRALVSNFKVATYNIMTVLLPLLTSTLRSRQRQHDPDLHSNDVI